jgi:ankyrin repeat protein
LVRNLIESGTYVDSIDDCWFKTALQRAAIAGHKDIAALLIDHGARVDYKDGSGFTSLHYAIEEDNTEVVELLIEKGAAVNAKNNAGRTPLDMAVIGRHKEIAQLLVDKGAKLSSFLLSFRLTSLLAQKDESDKDQAQVSVVESRQTEKFEPNTQKLNQALFVVVNNGQIDEVKELIAQGADINARDNILGWTPLHQAAQNKNVDLAKLLLSAGADVNSKNHSGHTPLDIAVLRRPNEVVDLIVKHDLESTDPPEPRHDLSINSIVSPSICTQGDTISITVNLANQGTFRESFALTLNNLSNGSKIANQTVTLGKEWTGKADDIPDMIFNGETQGDRFGVSVTTGGDVNGDKFPDIVATSARWNNGCGRAYLYYGGPHLDPEPDMLFDGHEEDSAFSPSVLSDLDNDGYTDLIVGSPGRTWGSEHDGYINIYYGGPQMDNVPDVVLKGETGSAEHIGNMIAASDIDNDGYVDIIAGAQGYDNLRGRVYLFWGGNPFDPMPDVVFEGEQENSLFGRKIDTNGDVNGDGYSDILVGARQFGGDKRNGRAYLFFGHAQEEMDSTCDWTSTGEVKGQMGSSVGLFDINADGYAEVIVGSRGVRSVYLFWGTEDFSPKEPHLVLQAPSAAALGGDDLECGYFNDDRFGDILVGAQGYPGTGYMYGRAYLFYGNTKAHMDGDHDYVYGGECGTDDFYGFDVCIGDANADNHLDALIGAVGANQDTGKVYLYYGPFYDTQNITFNWDTTNASIGKHILKVEISPIPGEQNIEDNIKNVTIEVTEPSR